MNNRDQSTSSDPLTPTDSAIATGRALVQALRAFRHLETKAGWFERLLIKVLRKTYQQRLRYLVGELPPEVSAEFFERRSKTI